MGMNGSTGIGEVDVKGVDKANTIEAQQRLVSISQQKQQLARLSILLDEAFTLPVIGVRVGWDAIIGLVPVIGDGAGAILSGYFVYKALRFKMPFTIVARMLLNIGVELLIGIVPLVGDVMDVAWKANRRNYRLMEAFFEAQEQALENVCQNEGVSTLTPVEPKGKGVKVQEEGVQGHLVMLLISVLIVCSMWANRETLESLVSSLEHEVGIAEIGVDEIGVDKSAEPDNSTTPPLETVTPGIRP